MKNLSPLENAIVSAVTSLQGTYRAKGREKASHGVHSVYSGIFGNVVKATGDKDKAIAVMNGLVTKGILYSKPARGGFSYATSPFPVAVKVSQADGFFAGV